MIKLRGLKLRYQLGLLIGIAVFLMVLTQLVYYFRFYYMTQEKAKIYANNIIKQVEENLNTTARGIYKSGFTVSYNKYVQEYLVSTDPLRRIELNAFITEMIKYMLYSNENIADIVLIDKDERINSFNTKMNSNIYKKWKLEYGFDQDTFTRPVYTSILNDTIYTGETFYSLIMPVLGVEKDIYADRKIGVCFVMCKADNLTDIVGKATISQNSLFFILDKSNRVVASNKNNMENIILDKELGLKSDLLQDSYVSQYNGKKSIIQYKTIKDTGWRVVSIIPISELTSDLKPIKSFGLIIGIIMVCMLSFIGIVFIRNITKPISEIVKMMKGVGDVNVRQRINIPFTNEVGIIARDINKMLDNIEAMTKKIFKNQSDLYEMELSKKQAELSALQSQINPHFLYNTLESIRCLGLINDDMQIVQISTAMANIFRYSIKGQEYASIRDEIKCIQDYLDIMNIRFAGRFTTKIEVDEKMMEMRTLKMILQPIVENAIYHGLEQRIGPGNLTINGSVKGDLIQFNVIDDGKGINEQELDRLQERLKDWNEHKGTHLGEKRSIGLTNINNRIKLYYGMQYGIRIFSQEDKGTHVIIELPKK